MFTARYEMTLYISVSLFLAFTRPCHGSGGSSPASQRDGTGSIPGQSFHMRFVMDKAAMEQVFLGVFPFPPAVIIPLTLHTHLHLHVALTSRSIGRSLRTFQRKNVLWQSRSIGQEIRGLSTCNIRGYHGR